MYKLDVEEVVLQFRGENLGQTGSGYYAKLKHVTE